MNFDLLPDRMMSHRIAKVTCALATVGALLAPGVAMARRGLSATDYIPGPSRVGQFGPSFSPRRGSFMQSFVRARLRQNLKHPEKYGRRRMAHPRPRRPSILQARQQLGAIRRGESRYSTGQLNRRTLQLLRNLQAPY